MQDSAPQKVPSIPPRLPGNFDHFLHCSNNILGLHRSELFTVTILKRICPLRSGKVTVTFTALHPARVTAKRGIYELECSQRINPEVMPAQSTQSLRIPDEAEV